MKWSFLIVCIAICITTTQGCDETSRFEGCHGARGGCCYTCEDVEAAYRAIGWAFDRTNRRFEQCHFKPAPGAPGAQNNPSGGFGIQSVQTQKTGCKRKERNRQYPYQPPRICVEWW
jgi:hypothetical protein